MINFIHLQNYRSFIEAEVELSPFTLVVGANGAGKTNLLQAFVDCTEDIDLAMRGREFSPGEYSTLQPHFNGGRTRPAIAFRWKDGKKIISNEVTKKDEEPKDIRIYRLSASRIAQSEPIEANPYVDWNGMGTTQVLELLKSGDRDDLFAAVERSLCSYVPEIEKLSFAVAAKGSKTMQVRERGISGAVPVGSLSEGTRLIIALLAIVHQSVKPPVICLEDVDRGIHPRVFEQVVTLMRSFAIRENVQVIATTHNPYLVDCFQDQPEAVVIVEKKDGASRLSNLSKRLDEIGYGDVSPNEMPLGNLWFSGLVGGVPDFLRKKVK